MILPASAAEAATEAYAVVLASLLLIFVMVDLPPFVTPRPTKLTPVLPGAGCDGG